MAEPQRVSPLPDARPRPKPRPPHPYAHARLRQNLDATENLTPPLKAREHPAPPPSAEEIATPEFHRQDRAREWEKRPSSRLAGDWIVAGVLLLGLALNAAVLMTSAALTPADVLLGAAVFVVGLALLVLMVLCRKTGGRAS